MHRFCYENSVVKTMQNGTEYSTSQNQLRTLVPMCISTMSCMAILDQIVGDVVTNHRLFANHTFLSLIS